MVRQATATAPRHPSRLRPAFRLAMASPSPASVPKVMREPSREVNAMKRVFQRIVAMFRRNRSRTILAGAAGLLAAAMLVCVAAGEWVSGIAWPEPKLVDPGPPGGPPSDAVVLFDGKSMSRGKGATNGPSATDTPLPP